MTDAYPWEGRLVRLRALRPDDWEHFHRWNQDPEWSWADNLTYPPLSPERTQSWLEGELARPRDGDSLRLVIETVDGEAVGSIDTNRCDPNNGTFWYALALPREHRRKGYGAEAARLLLGYYFRQRRYQKVTTFIGAFNEPSLRLHEKLGFQVEGRLRRMSFRFGQHHDEFVVGMTAEEYEERFRRG